MPGWRRYSPRSPQALTGSEGGGNGHPAASCDRRINPGPQRGHIRATNDQTATDNTGHQRFGILPAHRPESAIRRRSPPPPGALTHRRGHPVAGARLDLRAAGPLPHRPRPAGAGRQAHYALGPASRSRIRCSAARNGSPRLKNEWVRPGGVRVSLSRTFALDPRTTTSPGPWLRKLGMAISRGEVSSPSTPPPLPASLGVPNVSRLRPVQCCLSNARS